MPRTKHNTTGKGTHRERTARYTAEAKETAISRRRDFKKAAKEARKGGLSKSKSVAAGRQAMKEVL